MENEKYKRRSSFFNYKVETASENKPNANYVEQLNNEFNDWKKYEINTIEKFKIYWRNEKKRNEENENPMSKERNDFLDKKVDVTSFLQQTQDFAEEIEFYGHRKQYFLEKFGCLMKKIQDQEEDNRIKLNQLKLTEEAHNVCLSPH